VLDRLESLSTLEEGPNVSFYTLDEQLELLSKVLNAGDDMIGVEFLEEDYGGKIRCRSHPDVIACS